MMIRKVDNPYYPDKKMTIIQPIQYVYLKEQSTATTTTTTTEKTEYVIEERIVHAPMPIYMINYINQQSANH